MTGKVRFRYNPIFLPEYLSTVMISIPVSLLFLTTPLGRAQGGLKNPHAPIALAAYLLIGLFLLGLTAWYRSKYHRIWVMTDPSGEIRVIGNGRELPVADLDQVEERRGTFFGRAARKITLETGRGWPVDVCESLVNYDDFRRLMAELTGHPIRIANNTFPEELQRIQNHWKERHEMFPPPRTFKDAVDRLAWRCVCLLPVGVFDVLLNVGVILLLNRFGQLVFMVYSAPLSLLCSGFISRYVYYYMFTSTAMNKPIGASKR